MAPRLPVLGAPIASAGFGHLAQQVKQVGQDADLIRIDAIDPPFVPPPTTRPVVVLAAGRVVNPPRWRGLAGSWRT